MEGNTLINLEELRNEIRIKQGREKGIDFFMKLLKIYKGQHPIPSNFLDIDEYKHPYQIINKLEPKERNETLIKIKYHFDINNTTPDNKDISKKYWTSIYYLSHFIIEPSKVELLKNEELLTLLSHYQTEEELNNAEKEIRENIKYKSDDSDFWKDTYCLAKYLKHKLYLENLYNNTIQKQKNEIQPEEKGKLDIQPKGENLQKNENFGGGNAKKKGKRKGSLSPPGYESDEELRKIALTEHDFLFDLAEKRKIILIEKLKEYRENKINEEMNKNKNSQENKIDKKNNDENNLGENYQDAINFLNKIAQKNKKDKENLKKIKKREREKTEINNITVKSGLYPNNNNSPNNNSNIEINRENKNKLIMNKLFQYDEDNIPDMNMNQTNTINLMEEQINDMDEIGINERAFNECVEVDGNYDWSSKYKPIKPRYSNKVKMGFDWNRHNQAHYTSENLPPKTIQGYRFNIFYPYLVDKTKTPQYKIERSNTPDTCILRFHSGAPYEDIAFKIKNREWDMSEKSGFKNVFDKGILRLYFKFKRFKYKR